MVVLFIVHLHKHSACLSLRAVLGEWELLFPRIMTSQEGGRAVESQEPGVNLRLCVDIHGCVCLMDVQPFLCLLQKRLS